MGIAYVPLASLKFSRFSAIGLIFDPLQATCVGLALLIVLTSELLGGQNAAPSPAALRSLVS